MSDFAATTAASPLLPLEPPSEAPSVSGFWRRVAAFLIDRAVLGVLGLLLGALAYRPLAALGPKAQFIGFVIALAYFGIQNSRICGGRTLGKRALGIRCVDTLGNAISVPRSFARALLISLLVVDFDSYWAAASGVMPSVLRGVFGLVALATLFFLIFNRPGRRTLHDYVTGTCVVRGGTGSPSVQGISRAAIAGFVVLVIVGGVGIQVLYRLIPNRPFGIDLEQIQRGQTALLELPKVHTASISYMHTWRSGGGKSTTYGTVIWWSDLALDRSQAARDVAGVLLRNLADNPDGLKTPDHLAVEISAGYDLGIAQSFLSESFVKMPEEWSREIEASQKN